LLLKQSIKINCSNAAISIAIRMPTKLNRLFCRQYLLIAVWSFLYSIVLWHFEIF
jgi:hypothetical protein